MTIRKRRDPVDIDVLYKLSYAFLRDNFHKFSQANKIKVSLKLMEKYIDVHGAPPKEDDLTGRQLVFMDVPSNGDGKERFARFYN